MKNRRILFPALVFFIQSWLHLASAQTSCLNNGNYTLNSTYAVNLNTTFAILSRDVIDTGFSSATAGEGLDRAYALAVCVGDAQLDACRKCMRESAYEILLSCPNRKQAIRWDDRCMVRYSDAPIYGVLATVPTWYMRNGMNVSDATSPEEFVVVLRSLLDELRERASSGGSLRKFAAQSVTGPDYQAIYAMLQCMPDVSQEVCDKCLINAYGNGNMKAFCEGKRGCRILSPICTLRYESYRFYNDTRLQELETTVSLSPPEPVSSSGKGGSKSRTVMIIVAPTVLSLLLAISAIVWLRKKRTQKLTEPHHDNVDESISSPPESLQYAFSTIKLATNDFSDDNKLGQGGFGSVYKGKLPNGLEIAVKRLSMNSGQGDLEFKNEVLLLAKLQHRNLVRLLGFAGKDGTKTRTVIIIVVPTVSSLILAISAIVWLRKRKAQNTTEPHHENVDEISTPESLQYAFGTIKSATNDFSDDNKLGQGGFGSVYMGKLPNGPEIAVKRLSMNSGQGDLEFKNEVLLLAKLQHRNLVRLFGFAIKGTEKLLIYELVQNASLDKFIFEKKSRSYLDWDRRYKIIGGIARGILYLHEDSRLRIIHRDLKASNILLDGKMNPKIADFGMARLFGEDETQQNTNRVVGTYGYMAPEYAMEGVFSIKSDVFSFGVMLLEIISGKRNHGSFHHQDHISLLVYAWGLWKQGEEGELVDPMLRENCPIQQVERCIQIGLICVQENAEERPNMSQVVFFLENEVAELPRPNKPAFSAGRDAAAAVVLEHRSAAAFSVNQVTVSSIVPR